MTSQPSLHDLASAYALNAVDDDERRAFEAHLRSCERCQLEVAAVAETVAGMAEETAANPPQGLRTEVLAAIEGVQQLEPVPAPVHLGERRRGRRIAAWPLAAAAAVVVAAAASYALFGLGADDGFTVSEIEVANAADSVLIELEPADDITGEITVSWSADLDAVLVTADGLAEPGQGQVYALWFVLENGVAPAGLFSPVDGAISRVLPVDDLDALGWGVTIEPSGGSDQPTSAILYLGER